MLYSSVQLSATNFGGLLFRPPNARLVRLGTARSDWSLSVLDRCLILCLIANVSTAAWDLRALGCPAATFPRMQHSSPPNARSCSSWDSPKRLVNRVLDRCLILCLSANVSTEAWDLRALGCPAATFPRMQHSCRTYGCSIRWKHRCPHRHVTAGSGARFG